MEDSRQDLRTEDEKRSEDGGWRAEEGRWKREEGRSRIEDGGGRSEDRGMKTPEGGHKNEERGTGSASGAFPINSGDIIKDSWGAGAS